MTLPSPYSDNKDFLNVIIETPAKSRNKFVYDEKSGLFRLKKVLPAGMEFPYDFGFIPGTVADDGDPLDALVLMDLYTYPGCLVECRLVGALLAEQTEKDGSTIRNDRFIMIPVKMKESNNIRELKDINKNTLDSIVSFFENYNRRENKIFTLLGYAEAEEAHKLIKKQTRE